MARVPVPHSSQPGLSPTASLPTVVADLGSAVAGETEARADARGHGAEPAAQLGDPPRQLGGWQRGRRIGVGGMGAVYDAVKSEQHAALKIMRPDVMGDPDAKERFAREIAVMRQLDHSAVVRLFAAGVHEGWPWMALEFMPSGDLAQHLRRRGQLFEKQAIAIALQVAQGLAAIHAAGLIHRDLKPANIFMDKSRAHGSDAFDVKIGDLGMARSSTGTDRMTVTGTACGTPAFMAPEQVRGESDLDARVDLYALGATLFTLLTGHEPYGGETIYVVTHAVLNDPLPNIRTENPNVSDGMIAIIHKLCAKHRSERYQHATEVIADLERLRDGKQLLHVAAPTATRIFQEVMGTPAPKPVVRDFTAVQRSTTNGSFGDWLAGIGWAPIMRIAIPGAALCALLWLVSWWMDGRKGVSTATHDQGAVQIINGAAFISPVIAGIPLRLQWIPAGNSSGGSAPVGSWLLLDEVSEGLFAAVMEGSAQRPEQPIGDVTARDAVQFCTRLNQRLHGLGARLPSSDEWAHAAALTPGAAPNPCTVPEVIERWRAGVPPTTMLNEIYRDQRQSLGTEAVAYSGNQLRHLGDNVQEWVIADNGANAHEELRGGFFLCPAEHQGALVSYALPQGMTTPWTGFRIVIPGGAMPEWPAALRKP